MCNAPYRVSSSKKNESQYVVQTFRQASFTATPNLYRASLSFFLTYSKTRNYVLERSCRTHIVASLIFVPATVYVFNAYFEVCYLKVVKSIFRFFYEYMVMYMRMQKFRDLN